MQLSVVKGSVDFLPGIIIEREFHGACSIQVSSHKLVCPALSITRLPALWLTIHMEEKPQAKNDPEDDEGQASIMDDPFLLLLLRFGFGRECRFEGGSIAHVFATLVTVIVALWHLGVAERAHLHHGHS